MAREWLQGSLGGGPSRCVLFWDGSKWRVFGGFDVRGREARIPTGDEVVFSQLEVAQRRFWLGMGQLGGYDVENLKNLARFRGQESAAGSRRPALGEICLNPQSQRLRPALWWPTPNSSGTASSFEQSRDGEGDVLAMAVTVTTEGSS